MDIGVRFNIGQGGDTSPYIKRKREKVKICSWRSVPVGILNIISYNLFIFQVLLYFSFSLFRLFAENDNEGVILREVGEFLRYA